MNRAEFCRRMLPALRLALKQGYIRNDARTRGLLGYDPGIVGCKHLANRLCGYVKDGLLICTSGGKGGQRRLYRITTRGRLAVDSNAQHAQRHTVSARLASYFEAHPDEELTPSDIVAKLSCSAAQARRAVEYLVVKGALERVTIVRSARALQAERRAA